MSIEITRSGDGVAAAPERDVFKSMLRGVMQTCPACGEGRIFGRYLKVNDSCPSCHEELHHQRADDAPPYFTMFIVGHIVVAAVMAFIEQPVWVHAVVWPVVILGLSLWLLPRIKGALIGLQWALQMHGFGGEDELDPVFETDPRPTTE